MTTLARPSILYSVTLGLVTATALIVAYEVWAPLAGPSLAKLFGLWLTWLDDTYRILSLDYQDTGGVRRLHYAVSMAKPVYLGGRMIFTDPRAVADASIPFASVFVPAMVAMPVAIGWPAVRLLRRAIRIVLLLPVIALLVLLDVPLVLWAQVWAMQVNALDPDHISGLLFWSEFLQSGGRIVMGLLVSIGIIVSANTNSLRLKEGER